MPSDPTPHVLVVDDEEELCCQLEYYLRDSYVVESCFDFTAARDLILSPKNRYDVALIDIMLPRAAKAPLEPLAVELIEMIKRHSPTTEIIIFTGSGTEFLSNAFTAGCFYFLLKPLDLAQMAVLIRHAVRVRQARLVDVEKQMLARFAQVSAQLVGTRNEQHIISHVAETIHSAGFGRVHVCTLSSDRCSVVGQASVGTGSVCPAAVSVAGANVCNAELLQNPEPQVVSQPDGSAPFVCVPLVARGAVIGRLGMDNVLLFQDLKQPLALFTSHAAAAIETARILAETDNRARTLDAVLQASAMIGSSLALEETLVTACQAAVEILGASHSGLVLFAPNLETGKVEAEYPSIGAKGLVIPLRGVASEQQLVQSKRPLVVSNVETETDLGVVKDILLHLGIRSILIVPVLGKGCILGSFSVDAINHLRRFTEEEIRVCIVLATRVATAIEHAQLFEQTKHRADDLEALRRTTLEITGPLERDSLLKAIIQHAVALLNAKSGGIYEYVRESGELTIVADFNRPAHLLRELRAGEGMAGRLVLSDAPFMIVNDYNNWPDRAIMYQDGRPHGAVVEVPLRWQQNNIGVIYVDDDVGREFNEEDGRLLRLFADQAAIVMARVGHIDSQRYARWADLSRATAEILRGLATSTLDELLNLVAKNATEILNAESCGVFLVRREGFLSLEASYGELPGTFRKGRKFAIRSGPKTGLTGHIAHQSKMFKAHGSALVNHPAVAGREPNHSASGQCFSLFALPLKKPRGEDQTVCGLIRVDNKKDGNGCVDCVGGFTEEDEWILSIFAQVVLTAIESAGLIDRVAMLDRISKGIAQMGDLTNHLQSLAEEMVRALGCTFCRVLLADETASRFVVRAAFPVPRPFSASLRWTPDKDELSSAYLDPIGRLDGAKIVARQDHSVCSYIDQLSCRLKLNPGLQSVLLVPLTLDNRTIGILEVGEVRSPERAPFAQESIELANAIAARVSAFVGSARLHEIAERRRELLAGLDEALGHIRPDKEGLKLFQDIARLAAEMLAVPVAAIYRNRPHLQELELIVVHGLPSHLIGTRVGHSVGIAGLVASTKTVQHVEAYDEWTLREPFLIPYGLKMTIGAPFKQAGEVDAILVVADTIGGRLHATHCEILERFATRVALVLQASALMDVDAPVFRHLRVLQRITEYIQSEHSLDKILQAVLTGVTAGYGLEFNRAAVLFLDEDGAHLLGKNAIGYHDEDEARNDWKQHKVQGYEDFATYLTLLDQGHWRPTPLDERVGHVKIRLNDSGETARCIEERRWIRISEEQVCNLPQQLVELFEPTGPVILVPLIASNQVIGILVADNKFTRSPITDDSAESLLAFGTAAAIASENSRLYEQARAYEELHESALTRTRAASLDDVVHLVAIQALQSVRLGPHMDSGFSYVGLVDGGQLKWVAASTPQILEAVQREIGTVDLTGTRIGIPGRAIVRKCNQNVSDVRTDVDHLPVTGHTNSHISVVIQTDGRAIGVISIDRGKYDGFTREHRRNVEILATQAAVSIQNAEQYADLLRIKGLVGSRTATEWMRMVSTAWGHAIRRETGTAQRYSLLIEQQLQKGQTQRVLKDVEQLNRVLYRIAQIPIIAPLTAEEAVRSVGINGLVEQLARSIWQGTFYSGTRLVLGLEPNLDQVASARVSPEWLRRAVEVLLDNAVWAMEEHNTPIRRVVVSTQYINSFIEIGVEDTGPGIPLALIPTIFQEPIVKSADSRGAGLGLLEARTIVETYGGAIRIERTGPSGTVMMVSLPAEPPLGSEG